MEENNFQNQPTNGYEGVNVTVPQQPKRKKGLSIASLVLGILSILFLCCCGLNIITAPLAIIFGIVALCKHQDGTGLAVTGIITAVLSLLVIVGVAFSLREILPYSEEIVTDYSRILSEQDEIFPAYEEDGTIPEFLEKYTESPYTEIMDKYGITFKDIMDALLQQYKAGALTNPGLAATVSDSESAVKIDPDMGVMIPA